MEENIVDYSKIPLHALKKPVLNILAAGLNHHKILPNQDGLPRDWRGLAHLIGLNGIETGRIATMPDPYSALMLHWGKAGNLGLLQNFLAVIDRYDVLDDTKQLFESNSLEFLQNSKNINTPNPIINLEYDKSILTTDDVIRLENGMEPQIYDAYVLYAEEDANFAADIVCTMESKYNLKLCIRDRDLIGGVQFEHDAITKLIAERCRRLVVIVSPHFLKSKANKFFVTFAQALALDIRERKVIPILYEKCDIPPELSYYFFLDYNRASKLWNFWDKLRDSIQGPEPLNNMVKKETPLNAAPSQTKNDHWISRTHFEEKLRDQDITMEKKNELTLETKKIECESHTLKAGDKRKSNVYKIIKNSFSKAVRQSNSPEKSASNHKSSSFLTTLSSFMSNDNLLFENSDDSSCFEESKDTLPGKKVKTKKKWFKKKSIETLLS